LKLDQQLGNSTVVIDFRGDSAAASLKHFAAHSSFAVPSPISAAIPPRPH